jgi:uncharacterized membrane protein (UPF0182 family)
VIAAYGDRVVMEETLGQAFSALFANETTPAPAATEPGAGAMADRARQALDHYNRALERLTAGDWAGFGAELEAMRGLLQGMIAQPGSQ